MKLRGAERRGGADARRSRRPRRRADRAGRPRRHRRPRFGVGGLVDRLVGMFGARQRLRRAAAAPAARRGGGQPRAARSRGGVSPAGPGDQRRPLRRAGRPSALRRPHLHPPQDDARAGGAAIELERRALPQAAGADGAAVRRSAGGDHRHARARRSARLHDGGSRLPLSRYPSRRARRWRRSCAR